MALFRIASAEPTPALRAANVYARAPVAADYEQWARLRAASRDFLIPWEPTWPEDDLTRLAFRRRLRRYAKDARNDTAYAFFLFRAADDVLLGGLTLSNVRRGVAQACSLGYWMGAPFAGRGYMTEAVRTVLPFAFDVLRLHRVEAACMLSNAASIRVLEKAGFAREGMARKYLRIAGAWQDHLLFAAVAGDERS